MQAAQVLLEVGHLVTQPGGQLELQLRRGGLHLLGQLLGEVRQVRFLDVAGQAAAGRPPSTELTPALVRRWLDILVEHVDAPPAQRSAITGAVLAQLDGLMLIRLIGSPELADSAARGAWSAADQSSGH